MKKIVSGILIVVMLLSLTGCSSKSDDVKRVERLIKGIGTVTLEREQYIIEAEQAYDALPMAEKDSVSNYQKLEDARYQYDDLVLDKLIANATFRRETYRIPQFCYLRIENGNVSFHFEGKSDVTVPLKIEKEVFNFSSTGKTHCAVFTVGDEKFVITPAQLRGALVSGIYIKGYGFTSTSVPYVDKGTYTELTCK